MNENVENLNDNLNHIFLKSALEMERKERKEESGKLNHHHRPHGKK